jgi:hypothetical protein
VKFYDFIVELTKFRKKRKNKFLGGPKSSDDSCPSLANIRKNKWTKKRITIDFE